MADEAATLKMMLQCSICHEQFKEPRVLPCQHTFCRRCLQNTLEHQPKNDTLPCPECRNECHLISPDVKTLPKNIFAANLIDLVHKGGLDIDTGATANIKDARNLTVDGKTRASASSTKSGQPCTVSTDKCSESATVYCDKCEFFMCGKCEKSHQVNRFTRKHDTMPASEAIQQQRLPPCPKHKHMYLDAFCEDCMLPICATCFAVDHQKHYCIELADKMGDFRAQLDEVLTKTNISLKAIHKAIEITQEQGDKAEREIGTLRRQVASAYRTIRRAVDEQEESHMASIDKSYNQARKVIAETLDRQQTLEAMIHSIQLYGRYLCDGSSYDINTNLKSLEQRADKVIGKSVPQVRWRMKVTRERWRGRSQTDGVSLILDDLESDGQLTQYHRPQSVRLSDRGVKKYSTFTTEHDGKVTGMVSYNNHIFVVHSDHDTLYVYDDKGKLRNSVEIYCSKSKCKMMSPHGICMVQDEEEKHSIVISDRRGRCLWWLSVMKLEKVGIMDVGQPKQHKLQYHPWKLSTDRSGYAVVTDADNSRIYIYSHLGKHVTCLQLSSDMYLYQSLTDESDSYVVRNGTSGQLMWVNSSGDVKRRYADQPAVLVDNMVDDGVDLLVSDVKNHCVHIVTREGRYEGQLITDIDPTCFCLDPDGCCLWVAYEGKKGKRQVLELPYKPRSNITLCAVLPKLAK